MNNKTFNLIGPGQLGKVMAKLMVEQAGLTLKAVCATSKSKAQAGVDFIGHGEAISHVPALPPADFLFIAVGDKALLPVINSLAKENCIAPNTTLVHFSGVIGADVFAKFQAHGCVGVTVHPMHAFADPDVSIKQFAGTVCAVEGDVLAVSRVTELLQCIGAKVQLLHDGKKAMFHAGAILASSHFIALLESALQCLELSGFERETAFDVLIPLMRGIFQNLSTSQSTKDSFVGPLVRKDFSTIKQHLDALVDQPELLILYRSLTNVGLQLTEMTDEEKRQVRQL